MFVAETCTAKQTIETLYLLTATAADVLARLG